MNKYNLISAMAEKTGFTKRDSEKAINAFVDLVTEALVKGDEVQLIDFGTFKTGERKAKKGINPRTKEEIQIEAKTVAQFKAGKALAEAVNCKKKSCKKK